VPRVNSGETAYELQDVQDLLATAFEPDSKTATETLVVGDRAKLIIANGSSITLTLPSAVTAGDRWAILIKNINATDLTVKSSAGTIDTIAAATGITLALDAWGLFVSDGTNWLSTRQNQPTVEVPKNYLTGMTLSNDSGDTAHDISVAAGVVRDNADAITGTSTSAIVKQIDAADWGSGTGAGGRPSGVSLSADKWYYVFAIFATDGDVDFGFDDDISATNLLADSNVATAGFDQGYRRIGSVMTDGSSNIKQFYQLGDEFWWAYDEMADAEHTVTNTGANGTAVTLDNIPDGLQVRVYMGVVATGIGNSNVLGVVNGDDTVTALPPGAGSNIQWGASQHNSGSNESAIAEVSAICNTSNQVKFYASVTTADIDITVLGYIDPRGQ
jgi:hypothetical protein